MGFSKRVSAVQKQIKYTTVWCEPSTQNTQTFYDAQILFFFALYGLVIKGSTNEWCDWFSKNFSLLFSLLSLFFVTLIDNSKSSMVLVYKQNIISSINLNTAKFIISIQRFHFRTFIWRELNDLFVIYRFKLFTLVILLLHSCIFGTVICKINETFRSKVTFNKYSITSKKNSVSIELNTKLMI